MTQVYAEFDGLPVQVSAQMARTPGVTPDSGTLVWRANGTLPANVGGDLTFNIDGSGVIVTFRDCILSAPRQRNGQYVDQIYTVRDRRWRWKFPVLFGSYNVRDGNNQLIAGTKKNPQELAALALDALGENGYDVSVLPTDEDLGEHVMWHYEPAAAYLQRLVRSFGCDVHLLFDDTVAILQDGLGVIPGDILPGGTGLAVEPEVGLVVNHAPDHLSAYASDTLFDSWLSLGEPIAEDYDGQVKPIDQLQYKPTQGWEIYSPEHDQGMNCLLGPLNASGLSEEAKDKVRSIYRRDVFRKFRVTGFAGAATGPPGFPQFDNATNDYVLIEAIDDGTVVQVSTHATETAANAALHAATPAGNSVGLYVVPPNTNWNAIGYTAPSSIAWVLVTIEADGTYTATGSHADLEAAIAARGTEDLITPPEQTVFDYRLITPLEDTRIESQVGFNGQAQRLKAEVLGKFDVTNPKLLAKYGHRRTSDNLRMYYGSFSIDRERAVVEFDNPMSRFIGNKNRHPELYIRTGYRIRLNRFGNIWHRQYTLPTGNNLGTANGVTSRTDLSELKVQQYSNQYGDLTTTTTVSANTTSIDESLKATLTEELKTYQNLQAAQRKVYTPIEEVDTNGRVGQVHYSCGVGDFGYLTVSIGTQHDRRQPTAIQKRERVQQKAAERDIQRVIAPAAAEEKPAGRVT